MADQQPAVAIGQVWEEVDPRHPRKVTVVAFSVPFPYRMLDELVTIRGIENGRTTQSKLSRFNGKRGGYRFISDGAK